MAKATITPVVDQQADEVEAVTDPWTGLTAYPADAWTPPAPKLSPTILAFVQTLITHGKAAVVTEGWDTKRVKMFILQVKACRELLEGRKVYTKVGTINGQPALQVTLSKATS